MKEPGEPIEYLAETDGANQEEQAPAASVQQTAGAAATWLAVALLAVLVAVAAVGVVRLDQLIDRTDALIVEQQRVTCYERLQWLPDQFEDHPEGDDLRTGLSRRCEGDKPRIAFDSGDSETPRDGG